MTHYYLPRIHLFNITSVLSMGHKEMAKHKALVTQATYAMMMGLVPYVLLWELQTPSHIVAVQH